MGIEESRDALAALERELHVDTAGLEVQVQALGSAVEHVLDVLETMTNNRDHVDRQIEEARAMLARLWR